MRLAALVEQCAVVRTPQGPDEHTIHTRLEEGPAAPPLATLPGLDPRLLPELVAA